MKSKLLKATLLTLTAIVLVVATVFTTIAYLTSTAAVTNTFTVGNVGIQMFESLVDDKGVALQDNPNVNGDMKDSNGNTYHLLPGMTYAKDPTIYINAGSDASFLFVKIENGIRNIEAGNFEHANGQVGDNSVTDQPTIHEQMVNNGWIPLDDSNTVYVYATMNGSTIVPNPVGGTYGTAPVDVFETFTLDRHANASTYADAKVVVTAFAIQAGSFERDPYLAWAALVEAYPNETAGTNVPAPNTPTNPVE